MSAFRFRLEKVREHRRREVDRCSLSVAEARRRVERLGKMQERLAEDLERHAADMARLRNEATRSGQYQMGTSWLAHLHRQAAELDRMIADAMEAETRSRATLAAAWRDLEALNLLRTRQEAAWRLEQDRRERREMDEIGLGTGCRTPSAECSH
jgi:flagellar export protein FliJ